jgi:hypothetical protein
MDDILQHSQESIFVWLTDGVRSLVDNRNPEILCIVKSQVK